MKKKLLALVLCLVLVAAAVCVLSACKKDENAIVIWVGEGTKEFTEQLVKEWNETNQYGVKFNVTVRMVSESKAAGDALKKKQSAADIFCFAQDQLARLVDQNFLAPMSSQAIEAVEQNTDTAINAAKIGGTIRAFPMTEDNGYFMYYDKQAMSGVDMTSLEAIIAACNSKGMKFSMNLTDEGCGWYAASFFYGAGCKSEWTTNDDGSFNSYDDTFKNEELGLIALKGMQKLFKSGCLIDNKSAGAAHFDASPASAVVVSGIWDYSTAKKIHGDNLGVAPLPYFTDDAGNTHQLATYLGCKMMGVKKQESAEKAFYLQDLAMFLTNKENQLARFKKVGWGPSHAELQDNEDVLANEALQALKTSNVVPQGQYPTDWWTEIQVLTGSAKTANSDSALLTALREYARKLPDIKKS